MESLHLLHVTDTHLFEDKHTSKNGVVPAETLAMVLDEALLSRTPDALLVTGDVAQDPVRSTYEFFLETVSQRFSGQLIAIPGNHDDGALMQQMFPSSCQLTGSWSIVSLDTHLDGIVSGHVSTENLDRLAAELNNVEGNLLLTGHHPIIDIGAKWLDAHRVDNGQLVVSMLEQCSQSKAYLCGHIHQEFDCTRNGIRYLATPSTVWQFARGVDSFALDDLQPGWRWLTLGDDGTIVTEVFRLGKA